MMVAAQSVYQLLAGVSGALIAVIVALGIALARTRERLSKLEEWARVQEKKLDKLNGERSGQ